MISLNTIKTLLASRLGQVPDLPRVIWTDQPHDDMIGEPHILAQIAGVERRPVDGCTIRTSGRLRVQVRYPTGEAALAERAGAAIERAFPANGSLLDLTHGLATDWCCAGGVISDGAWHTCPVAVAWSAYSEG